MNDNFLSMLQKYNREKKQKPLSRLINEPNRFNDFSSNCGCVLFDFSRTGLDQDALSLLINLAEECGICEARDRLFAGEMINFTEQRPALHMATRSDLVLQTLDEETVESVTDTRNRMLSHAAAFEAGHLPGDEDQKVRHIIHIGIGGSVLGPRLLIEALGRNDSPQVHFLSSVDAHLRSKVLASIDPADTVVVIASKSFTTAESLLHAQRVFSWLEQALGHDAATQRLFAVSGNQALVEAFGVPAVGKSSTATLSPSRKEIS